jgi:hypothetical protein
VEQDKRRKTQKLGERLISQIYLNPINKIDIQFDILLEFIN